MVPKLAPQHENILSVLGSISPRGIIERLDEKCVVELVG
jgi:hypothetical protein